MPVLIHLVQRIIRHAWHHAGNGFPSLLGAFQRSSRVGDTVFSKIHKAKCKVSRKYDEEYVEYLKDGYITTVDNPYLGDESIEGVSFSVYWNLADGTNMGLLPSVEAMIKNIENTLIKEGQEFYRVKVQNAEGDDYYGFCKRGDLYRI